MSEEFEGVITVKPGDSPRVRGTRITIYDVMDHHVNGDPPKYIAGLFNLPERDVLAAIAYIEANRAELTPVYEGILARNAKGDSPEVRATLAASHARMLERLEQLNAAREARQRAGDVATAG